MKNIAETIWNSKWSLSLSFGILLGLSWPPLPFPFLVFPAFFLLFRLIDLCDSAKNAAYWTYPGLVVWNIITTYWLVMASVAAGIAAVIANAAVMTVPIMLMYLFQNKLSKGWLIALLQTSVWISYEYFHHHWDLAWPWLAIGNAWANVPSLVQYISVTGYLGISFWVLIVTALAYQAMRNTDRVLTWSAAGLTLLFPFISIVQYMSIDSNSIQSEQNIEAVVAQPNYDTYQPYGSYSSPKEALDTIIQLSDSARSDSTDLVLWPESGITTRLYSEAVSDQTANEIKNRLFSLADNWDLALVTGTRYFEYYSPENAPALARGSGTDPYLYYNAALGFYPGRTYKVYRKNNLVPIVERLPFVHFLDAVDVFDWVPWADIQAFGKGYDPDQFTVERTAAPALICYDSVFPDWVREYVLRDAGFITIITNDGWWGDTSGHEQHFAYARLRAIEFRRWVVRSANNGISGIIDPSGAIEIETKYWTQTAFRYRVPILNELTFYARYGDWLPIALVIFTGAGILVLLNQKRSGSWPNLNGSKQ